MEDLFFVAMVRAIPVQTQKVLDDLVDFIDSIKLKGVFDFLVSVIVMFGPMTFGVILLHHEISWWISVPVLVSGAIWFVLSLLSAFAVMLSNP